MRVHTSTTVAQRRKIGAAMTLCAATALTLFAFAPGRARAGEAKAVMPVSATVLAYSNVATLRQPDQLVVTAADVAHGYVDVPAATVMRIRSNSPLGHLLTLQSLDAMFAPVRVYGSGAAGELSADGSALLIPVAAYNRPLELSFRLVLDARVRPGAYAWPLSLTVVPL